MPEIVKPEVFDPCCPDHSLEAVIDTFEALAGLYAGEDVCILDIPAPKLSPLMQNMLTNNAMH